MAIVESKSDGKDQPKSFPLTGLLDLHMRTKALARALHFLYPGAAAVPAPQLLLPQALFAVAKALKHVVREVGTHHVEYATYLAAVIESGIDRYLSALTYVAQRVVDYPTLVHVNSVPSCVHFDALLEDLRNNDTLHYQVRQWTLRPLPAPSAPAPPAGAPAAGASTTAAPPVGRRLPKDFAATHMPIDPNHPTKQPFCLKHLLSKSCDANRCKFSHGALPANAFSNEALQALLKGMAGN
jgi:hypothetical protein